MSEISVSKITGVSNFNGNVRFDAIRTMANNAQNQANTAANSVNNMVIGYHTLWIPASAFLGVEGIEPNQQWGNQPTMNIGFPAFETMYTSALMTLEFSESASQYAHAIVSLPAGWTGKNLNVDLVSTSPVNCSPGANVGAWIVYAGLIGDQMNVDSWVTSYNAASSMEFRPWYGERNTLNFVSNASWTQNAVPIGSSNTWTGNSEQSLLIVLTRYVDNATDNVPNPLKFYGMTLKYPISQKKND